MMDGCQAQQNKQWKKVIELRSYDWAIEKYSRSQFSRVFAKKTFPLFVSTQLDDRVKVLTMQET